MNAKVARYLKPGTYFVSGVMLVSFNLIVVKGPVSPVKLVGGVIKQVVHHHQTVSNANKAPIRLQQVLQAPTPVTHAHQDLEVQFWVQKIATYVCHVK